MTAAPRPAPAAPACPTCGAVMQLTAMLLPSSRSPPRLGGETFIVRENRTTSARVGSVLPRRCRLPRARHSRTEGVVLRSAERRSTTSLPCSARLKRSEAAPASAAPDPHPSSRSSFSQQVPVQIPKPVPSNVGFVQRGLCGGAAPHEALIYIPTDNMAPAGLIRLLHCPDDRFSKIPATPMPSRYRRRARSCRSTEHRPTWRRAVRMS